MVGIASRGAKSIEMIELLVKNGADPNILGDQNVPDNDIDRQWQSVPLLVFAAQRRDVTMFESALKFETTLLKQIINFSDKRTGGTPLMVAVVNGYTEIVRILVQAGADVNVEDRYVCIYVYYGCQYQKR